MFLTQSRIPPCSTALKATKGPLIPENTLTTRNNPHAETTDATTSETEREKRRIRIVVLLYFFEEHFLFQPHPVR